jgi:ectoine hydroxylase-related dioxygenase (phytanoyl-CoA dioxygenase family)
MAAPTPSPLDQATIEAYRADGAVVLRGLFADWIAPLREGVEQLMAAPSPLERSYQPEGSARFFQDLCNWQRIAAFRDFVFRSPAAAVAATLMGSREARFFHDHVLVKEPGTALVTPWHQDLPYYCVGGPHHLSLWIPLDPVPRETSLECVAGSHLWGITHKPKRFDGTDLYVGDDRIPMPDIDAKRADYRILGWALEPGDAVAFDFASVHGAAATQGAQHRRRVFSARWVGEDSCFIDRQGKGSPPFRHLTLKTGEPLDGPDFPVVYSEGRHA